MKELLRNIYFKVISICLIILLVVIGMIGMIRKTANESIRREYLNALNGSFEFHAGAFEKDLQNAVMALNIIAVDEDVARYLYQYDILSYYDRNEAVNDVRTLFFQFECMNGLIQDLGVITEGQERELSYLDLEEKKDFFSPQENAVFYIDENRIFLVKDESSDKITGPVFYMEMQRDYFDQLLEGIRAVAPEAEAAFVEKERVIFESSEGFFDSVPLAGEEQQDGIFSDGERIYFSYPIYLNSLKLYVCLPDNPMDSPVRAMDTVNYIVVAVILLLAVFLLLYTNHVLNRPMKRLVALMKEVGNGNLDVEIQENKNDQFGFIFNGFRKMTDNLKEYIRINYNQRLEIERSELKQLQAQINPHFLYNCFFNISNLCKIEDMETAALFSQKLAAYYMYITRNRRDEVMLKEEWKHATDYLEIQSIRFYQRVELDIQTLTEEEERPRVPSIILQPNLENWYKYVFEKNDETGHLRMHCRYDGNVLELVVEDSGGESGGTGIGQINEALNHPQEDRESTGIVNVSRRIRLKNKKNELKVEKSELGGWKVTIKIVYE